MHCPQSYEAATELDEIAAVPHQILRPRDGLPVIGIVQDTLVGSYRLTREHVKLNRREFMNLMMWNRRHNGTIPAPKAEGQKWTGHQVLSQLMPPINLEMNNSSKKKVVIREGEILEGQFDKSIYSKASKGIIHMTYKDYGSKDTVDMIDALQNTIEQFLVYNGFSVGISDLIADSSTKDEMNKKIQEKKSEVETILLQIHQDLFDNNTGKSNQSEFEDKVFGTLNKATETAGEIGQNSLANENRMTAMVRAGSKGGPINIAQMIACVGQQNIEGKRIPNGFEDRTLPHFKKYDDGAEARGFIENSFISGLTPTEFFFHAMSGREGLIDTAVKSIKYDTTLVIYDGKTTKRVKAGEWIDSKLAAADEDEIEYYPNDANMELLNLTEEVFIPTTDEDGRVSWGQMTAITRHDPGHDLYEIRTKSGRDVTVTASKSLLIWNANTKKFEPRLTGDVKVGDCVPVTTILGAPPEVKAQICLSDYLRKDEFLYGTEYRVAADLFAEKESADCYELNRWWKEQNGTTFTLPYKKFNDFRLSLKRTNMMDIQSGFVYSWCKPDASFMIPEFLPLNERTGILMGLYIADGNADIASGYIQVTKNDPVIRTFARQWFEEMGVTCRERVEQRPKGVSSDVRGFSTVLAKLFIKMCGKGSAEKRIPHECFGASDAFVRGLLNGYFSGDGCIAPNGGIQSSSVSQEVTEGIAMMCSRIGVFAKIGKIHQKTNNALPAYTLSIRAQWATRFAEQITLLNEEKRDKLAKMSFNTKHMNYIGMNDVVLDTITEIRWIDPAKHPKMYDVTVPSTLNFGLANGLQVRDTADTGYIQRQLVKAMEDLVVHHDGTVRDANMNIAQLHYGEDGINSTKIEALNLEISKLTDKEIAAEFGLEGMDLTSVLGEGVDRGNDAEALAAFVEEVKADRKMLVEGVFRRGRQGGVFAAVNMERLIFNIKTKFGLTQEQRTNLTPLHVLTGITRVLENTQKFHKTWAALLRYYMAPAKIIIKERFTESAFDTLCEMLITKNWQAWVQPGELVGIIAAQSIGEPSTQMSVLASSIVIINSKTLHYKGPVGILLDSILEKHKNQVVNLGNNSVVLDLKDELQIMGVSDNERTSWKNISQISRHPANGGLVEVYTRTGRKTTATLSHSFLKRSTKGIVSVLGSELKIGMRIPIATHIPRVTNPIHNVKINSTVFTLDKEFGWVCGIYLADGSMSGNSVKICKIHPIVEDILRKFCKTYKFGFETKYYEGEYGPGKDNIIKSKELKQFLLTHFGHGSYTKTIDYLTYNSPLEFIQGVIGGYFDGDGNVNSNRQQVRVSSRSKNLIRDVNLLLGYCGMFGIMGTETSVLIPGNISYTLNIPRKYAVHYKNIIGFQLYEKAAGLDTIIDYMNREEKHDTKDIYDKIPELGEVIAQTGKLLRMPGQSRTYGRWTHKESVGRRTLQEYIGNFKEMMEVHVDEDVRGVVEENIAVLESAANSNVLWDEIVDLVYLDDPKEFVYDFTVPGNDSFMVDDAILVHNTLNTFHLAGVASKSNVTRGVPRLKEVLKVTQNPKATSLTISLKPEYANNKTKAREVAQELELTLLRDMTVKTAIYYDPKDSQSVLKEDRELLEFYKLFEMSESQMAWSKYILRIELDRQRMFDRNITMDDIHFVLRERLGSNINIIYSDFNSQKLVMRIRLSSEYMEETKTDPASMDMMSAYKKFQNKLLNSVIIRGLPGIKAATFRKGDERYVFNEKEGKYETTEEYILDTDGSNFLEVMNHPAVDASRVYSTHVHDIYMQLGIEAARATLYNEIQTLFEEGQINYRHLGLLVDVMCRAGRLMSVDRYGINKLDIGPLAKASFEETERILLKAAVFGEMDPITGVSANIMTGQPIRAGTAFSDILLDEVAVLRLQKGLPSVGPLDEEQAPPTDKEVEDELFQNPDDICNTNRLRMNITLPKSTTLIEDEPDIEIAVLEDDD